MTDPRGTATAPTQRRPALPGWLVGSGVIALAMGVMNLTTYAFTLVAARVLGSREYGQLAAAMGVLLILNVVSLGLQATGARRISSAPALLRRTERDVLGATYRAAAVLGGATLVLAPVLSRLLRLDVAVVVLLALAAVPLTVMGGQAGVLQGERRWLPLAGVYAGMGLGRLGAGVVGLVLEPDASTAMLAVAVGALVPAVIGWAVLRRPAPSPARSPVGPSAAEPAVAEHPRQPILPEVLRNSHALLAFFALSNADVLLARAVLDDHRSGLYAAGLILTKAVLFLPQFIVVLVFPSMSADTARRGVQTRALGLILALGLCAVAVAAVLPGLAVLFVGGEAYAGLTGRLWAFAALGTLLAMAQLLVYGVVARQHRSGVYVLWAGLLVLLAAAPFLHSVTTLLSAVTSVQLLVLAGLALLGRRDRGAAPPA